jgi:transposase
MIENYFNYIKKRMEEDDGLYLKTLWSELRQMGYPEGYSTLSEALAYYGIRIGKKARNPKTPQHSGSFFKPSNAAMLFLTSENRLTATQKKLIDKLCKSSCGLEHALVLVRDFRNLMENKLGNQLQGWIENVLHSGISEMATFANGLLRDYQSIKNAISLPWSDGPVEGNVNKLKTIKRQMYGRASFDLLRKRLVLKPT